MFVIYAYKDGEEGGFEDGSQHAFGPYDDMDNALEDEASLQDGPLGWQTEVLPVTILPANA
jgi:hypothetical protein